MSASRYDLNVSYEWLVCSYRGALHGSYRIIHSLKHNLDPHFSPFALYGPLLIVSIAVGFSHGL
jgi:hypothetical protein